MIRAASEAGFMQAVVQLAHLHRWRAAHFQASLSKSGKHITAVAFDAKGFFDVVLMRERVVFVEVKTNAGSQTPEQKEWMEAAKRAGAEAYIWRPRDWSKIEELLR